MKKAWTWVGGGVVFARRFAWLVPLSRWLAASP